MIRQKPFGERQSGRFDRLQRHSHRSRCLAPEHSVDDALFRPEVGDAYRSLVEQGWTSAECGTHCVD